MEIGINGMMDPDSKIGGTKIKIYMWQVYLIMFIITAVISWLWVRGIDKMNKYQKEHPDEDLSKGWLDWDDNKATTEGGI